MTELALTMATCRFCKHTWPIRQPWTPRRCPNKLCAKRNPVSDSDKTPA